MLQRGVRLKRHLRQANLCILRMAKAWKEVQRLCPDVMPADNPFRGVALEQWAKSCESAETAEFTVGKAGIPAPTVGGGRDDRDRGCRQVPYPCRQRLRRTGPATCARSAGAAMIPVPSGVRVCLAVGRTDMRRGMNGLALQVQEALQRDPHAGDLFVFRGTRGNLIKILWHDGLGMSLYAKRLERGRFIWPTVAAGAIAISPSQLAYMLDRIDWRNPVHTFRPERAG
jgi:transposase